MTCLVVFTINIQTADACFGQQSGGQTGGVTGQCPSTEGQMGICIATECPAAGCPTGQKCCPTPCGGQKCSATV